MLAKCCFQYFIKVASSASLIETGIWFQSWPALNRKDLPLKTKDFHVELPCLSQTEEVVYILVTKYSLHINNKLLDNFYSIVSIVVKFGVDLVVLWHYKPG